MSRRALLLLDYQREFLDPSVGRCLIHPIPPAFTPSLHRLISAFRASNSGPIVWVRSESKGIQRELEYTGERVITSLSSDGSSPIPSDEDDTIPGKKKAGRKKRKQKPAPLKSDAFFSVPVNLSPLMPGSKGAEWWPEAEEMMQHQDLVVTKHFYSAFRFTSLQHQLQSRMVTEVYIAGSLLNIGVLATVADGARAFNVKVVKDCCGWQDEAAAGRALGICEQELECAPVTSIDIAKDFEQELRCGRRGGGGLVSLEGLLKGGVGASAMRLEDVAGMVSRIRGGLVAGGDQVNGINTAGRDGKVVKIAPPEGLRRPVTAPVRVEMAMAVPVTGEEGVKGIRPASMASVPRGELGTEEMSPIEVGSSSDDDGFSYIPPPPTRTGIAKVGVVTKEKETVSKASGKLVGTEGMEPIEAESTIKRSIPMKLVGTEGMQPIEVEPDLVGEEVKGRYVLPTIPAPQMKLVHKKPMVVRRPGTGGRKGEERKKMEGGKSAGKTEEFRPVKGDEMNAKKMREASLGGESTPKSNIKATNSTSSPQPQSSPPSLEIAMSELSLSPDYITPQMCKTAAKEKRRKAFDSAAPVLGPADAIGTGDSHLYLNLLPETLSTNAFDTLLHEVQWRTMYHRGGSVPRLVAVQGHVATTSDPSGLSPGTHPIYRHPSDSSPPLLPFTPTIDAIRRAAEAKLEHPLNHVLIQHYRSGNDYISEHSDKTLDIARGSCIINVSLGAERLMTLRGKPNTAPAGETRPHQRIPLPHNSLFVLGPKTNCTWLHSIKQDKRDRGLKSPDELANSGARISLTFRYIATYLNVEETLIWGQGATAKSEADAKPVINGPSPEAEKLLEAFGRENQDPEFDWDAYYGSGHDVLHFQPLTPRIRVLVPGKEDEKAKAETGDVMKARRRKAVVMAAVLGAFGVEDFVEEEVTAAPTGEEDNGGDGDAEGVVFEDSDVHRTEVRSVEVLVAWLWKRAKRYGEGWVRVAERAGCVERGERRGEWGIWAAGDPEIQKVVEAVKPFQEERYRKEQGEK